MKLLYIISAVVFHYVLALSKEKHNIIVLLIIK